MTLEFAGYAYHAGFGTPSISMNLLTLREKERILCLGHPDRPTRSIRFAERLTRSRQFADVKFVSA